jgi:threonine dehydrogenase-like Zn-dependent dehydrogenase
MRQWAKAGLFGYSHLLGGYAGGRAEYLRVPFADVGPIEIPGCGPVGQFAIRSAFLLGAERVLATGTQPERMELARGRRRDVGF